MANFAQLLRKPADEVKRPEALPDGTYFGTIQGHEFGESKQKKTPYIQFNIILTHAGDGVDTEGLEPNGRKFRDTYYLTEDAMWRLKDFLEGLGVNTEGRSFDELIPQTQGRSVMLDIARAPNQAGDGFYNNVQKVTGMAKQEESPVEVAPTRARRGSAA